MSNPIRLSSKREPDSERLTTLLEEQKRLRIRLAEVEAELGAVMARRMAAAQAPQRRDRLAYRIDEVAKLIGLGETTVRAAIERGDLRSTSVNPSVSGSARLIRTADLDEWLARIG